MSWSPAVSLDEGLERTIRFVRDNATLYDAARYVL